MLTAFPILVVTYIAVVELVTGYLFNKDEDKVLESIITKLQDYDLQLRENNKK